MAIEVLIPKNAGERMLVSCDPDKCDGCGICELVCSQAKEGAFIPFLARIRTMRLDHVANIAIACRQCEDPVCVKACTKTEALKLVDHLLSCDHEKCNLCGWCVEACPFGCLFLDSRADNLCVIACDLCIHDRIESEPPCVKYCPKQALTLESAESLAQKERENIIYAQLRTLEMESQQAEATIKVK